MGTVNLACNTRMTQLMFIDNRAFPGGPNAWFNANYSNGVNTAGNASYIIANFFADSLLVSLRGSPTIEHSCALISETVMENIRCLEYSVDHRPAHPDLYGLDM